MHVALIGATGRTGTLVLDELLRRGHTVAALVRDPAKVRDVPEGLTLVTGDSRDRDALVTLLAGADAVVSALGPTAKEADLHTDTAKALVAEMRRAGVRRFVGISGAGIDVPGDEKSLSGKLISKAIQTLGGAVVKDKPAEYAVLAESDLDWTLVRPPRLADGPATGRLEHDAHRSTRSTKVTRADLAAFVVDVAEEGRYVRQAPFVATAR
jgi:putative NADH-flavin reductase